MNHAAKTLLYLGKHNFNSCYNTGRYFASSSLHETSFNPNDFCQPRHCLRKKHLYQKRGLCFLLLPCSKLGTAPHLLKSSYSECWQQRLLHTAASLHSNKKDDSSAGSPVQDSKKAPNITLKVVPKKREGRPKIDFNREYTERNFVTGVRAMNDYILKPKDLDGLRKIERRSPFEDAPPITVFLRKDVESKALEVWGSREALQREQRKRWEAEQKYRDNIFHVKKVLRDYSRAQTEQIEQKKREEILRGAGRVVLTAVIINSANFTFKLLAWLYTGSHSLFAEAIHSFADTCNQLILGFGIRKSIQVADQDHPYGYHNFRYVASLISGVGIFCFGTGVSLYHGVTGLLYPEAMEPLYWAYFVLGGSLISEGGTLMVAYNEILKGAKREGMAVKDYILRSQDPSVNVVLLEDMAAVLGVGIAASCMGISSIMGNPMFDAIGSLLIGGLLGVVASFIIYTNSIALVGRSISMERMEQINKELESDIMIRAIHDVKATEMGNSIVRYKAEVDFDGRELTRSYLDSQDLETLVTEMQNVKSIEEVEAFILKHGENIVDLLGAEVDRIEKTLKNRHPEVRHVDLEVL